MFCKLFTCTHAHIKIIIVYLFVFQGSVFALLIFIDMYLNTTRYYPPFVRQISRRLVCTTGHTMLFSQMGATVIVLLLAVASCHETGLEAERKLRGGFVAFCVTRSFLYLFFLLRSP